jgi:hypothetical protein
MASTTAAARLRGAAAAVWRLGMGTANGLLVGRGRRGGRGCCDRFARCSRRWRVGTAPAGTQSLLVLYRSESDTGFLGFLPIANPMSGHRRRGIVPASSALPQAVEAHHRTPNVAAIEPFMCTATVPGSGASVVARGGDCDAEQAASRTHSASKTSWRERLSRLGGFIIELARWSLRCHGLIGRSGGIRTHDPQSPRLMRYQTALRSDRWGAIL